MNCLHIKMTVVKSFYDDINDQQMEICKCSCGKYWLVPEGTKYNLFNRIEWALVDGL